MKDEKQIIRPGKYHGSEYVDGVNTVTRSIINARRLDGIDEALKQIGDVVEPENLLFADGSVVATQATRAEDVISNEDIRLQSEIDGKVDIASYVVEQDAQDVLIQANTDAIISNDTDIVNLDTRLSTAEVDIDNIETEQVTQNGRLDAVEAKNIEQDTRLDNIDAKDLQQDNRLDVLEAEGTANVQDVARMTLSPGLVGTTPDYAVFTVDKPFGKPEINEIVQEANATTIVNKQEMTGLLSYEFTLEQGTGSVIELTIEAVDYATGTAIPGTEKTFTVDFTGQTEYISRTIVIADIFPVGTYALSAYTASGDVNFTTGTCTIINQTTTGGSEVIYDYDVTSTSNVGGATTKEDINFLNDNKADKTELTNKADLTYVDSEVNKKVDLLEDNDLRRKRTRFTRTVNSDSFTVIQMTITDLDTATTTGSVSLREDDTGVYLRGTKISTPVQDQDFTPKFYVDGLRDGLKEELMAEIKSLKTRIKELER